MKRKNNLKNYILFIISVFIVALSVNFKANAVCIVPDAPTQDIFVQDYANMIDDDSKNQLLQMSETLRDNGTAEIAIVTIQSLNGNDLDEYANTLFKKWGIGNKDTNNGILILLVQDSHKDRIEVGAGLEGTINDAKAGDVIRLMTPSFKDGKFGEGLIAGHQALTKMIAGEEVTVPQDKNNDNNILLILAIIFIIGCIIIVLMSKISGGSSDGGFWSDGGSSGGFDSFGGGSSGGGGADGGW